MYTQAGSVCKVGEACVGTCVVDGFQHTMFH